MVVPTCRQTKILLELAPDPVELGVGGEVAHLEQPLDRFARPLEGNTAIVGAGDGQDFPVELGRGAAVQTELSADDTFARSERGQVHEAEAQRPLHLPRPLAAEEDDGTVGVDPLDRLAQAATREEVDDPGLAALAVQVRRYHDRAGDGGQPMAIAGRS